MDALAGLAFGHRRRQRDSRARGERTGSHRGQYAPLGGCVAACSWRLSTGLLTIIGAQSRTLYSICADGGEALYLIAHHYFKDAGGDHPGG